MSKKYLFGMFAAASLLFATSCSDELDSGNVGNTATVSFKLNVEDGVQSRAISDGLKADRLVYAVFDANGNRIETMDKVDKTGVTFPTTEAITLVKGQKYKIAFWAQDSKCTAYDLDNNMVLDIDYKGVNNDESRDAFFKTIDYTVDNNSASTHSVTVELKRPFAQLNVGVYESDWNGAVKAGYTIEKSEVEISNVAATMDLVTGNVSNPVDIHYTPEAIPTGKLVLTKDEDNDDEDGDENDGTMNDFTDGEEYHYLSMSYILVNDETENGDKRAVLNTVAFKFLPKNGEAIEFSQGLVNIPVQRNWRTNIVGRLLTSDAEYTITIDPGYDGEINHNTGAIDKGNRTYEINSAAAMMEIAKIIANTSHGEGNPLNFLLTDDVDMTGLEWTPLAGLFINFDGQGHTISNLNCGTDANGRSGLFGYIGGTTLKNVTLHNVTAAGEQAGIIGGNAEGTTISNVTITGMNYVSYKDVEGYDESWGGVGAIFGVNSTSGQTVDVTIAKDAAVYVSKADLTNTQASEGNIYSMLNETEVTANNGTVTFAKMIAEGLVYDVTTKTYLVSSKEGLIYLADGEASIKGGETVKLMTDIDLAGVEFAGLSAFNSENPNTFDGQGYTVSNVTNTGGSTDMGFIKSWVGTIKNVTIKDANYKTAGRSAILAGQVYGNIENCHIVGGSIEDSYWACGAIVGLFNSGNIKDCTVNNVSITSAAGGVGGIVGVINETAGNREITDCKVINSTITNKSNSEVYTDAAIVGMININNSTVAFTNCVVENCNIDNIYDYVEENTGVIIDGVYDISSANQMFWFANEVNTNGNSFSGKTVQLSADIDLSEKEWNPIGQTGATTFHGKFDGQGHTISGMKAVYKNGDTSAAGLFGWIEEHTAEVSIENVTISNATVESDDYAAALVGWIGGSGAIKTIKNCKVVNSTITGGGSTGAIVGHDTAKSTDISSVTVTGCTIKGERADKSGIVVGTIQNETNLSGVIQNSNTVFDVADSEVVYGRIVGGCLFMDGVAIVNGSDHIAHVIEKGIYTINLTEGTYIIPTANNKTLSFIGIGDAANTIITLNKADSGALNNSKATFENVSINTDSETYTGYTHSTNTYKNCIINGMFCLYHKAEGDVVKFEKCTFNVTGNLYNVWTWGATADFTECTFNCSGKSLLVYGYGTSTVTFNTCKFNDNGGQDGKAAIETGNDYSATYTIHINGCEVNGFDINPEGINTGSAIWANKNSMSNDELHVFIDGKEIY